MTNDKIFARLLIKMKKTLKYIIFLIFVLPVFFLSAYSYQAFDGKYNYGEYQQGNNYSANVSSEDEEVLFIVDFSNSMSKKMGFAPRVYHAIDAIRDILNDAGDRTKIGLRIFGVTDKPILQQDANGVSWHKENLCSASSLVMPIARYNSANISDKLGELTPQGVTPIGYSLRQAVQNDFSPSAPIKHIILITDGGENCGDDPCLFIKRLMQLRDDIKIDVIGITVEDNAYSQLNCIAAAAKGKYYSVNTPEDFKLKFEQAFNSTPKLTVTPQPIKTNTIAPVQSGIKYKNYVFEFNN